MSKIYEDISRTIGRTPLVRLNRLTEGCGAEVVVKLESFNPQASVKDRIGLSMIEAAESRGELKVGGTIVESTSGNTGIGIACVAAARGYRCVLVMPDTMSVERRVLLLALGAEVVLTPGKLGMKGAMTRTQQLVDENPGWITLGQFDNPANPEVHRRTTGVEIWEDTGGEVDVLVVGVGTGGTISGTSRVLKEHNAQLRTVAVEPAESAVLSGGDPGPHKIQGIGAGFVPKNYDAKVVDEVVTSKLAEACEAAHRLGREEGILVGISGGAILHAALIVAARPESFGKRIVAILPDTGERYLSTGLFEELLERARRLATEDIPGM